MPNLFHYTDYRAWLKDALQALKERDPKMSQRWIQQRLGVKTSGWLADLLAGRRRLARGQMEVFSRLFGLSAREELYFQTLVDYAHASNQPARNRAFEKLATFHEVPKDVIDPDRLEYFGTWYHAAIREYLLLEPLRGEPETLADKLVPPITPQQARESVELLERLGMIKRYASGEWRPAVEHVKKSTLFGAEHYSRYIRAQMELGMDAVERIPKEERDVSALTLSLSEAGFAAFREELKELRARMIRLSETENTQFWKGVDGDSRRIYTALLQLFPVSRTRRPGDRS